jgi:hypothetical protein
MAARLRKLRDAGVKPRIEIVADRLPNAKTAHLMEAASIDLLGWC